MLTIDVKLIGQLDLFKGLLPRELEKIVPLLHHMKINEGEEFITIGQPAKTLYIILSGNYMVYFKNGNAFTVHYRGDIVGWTTVVTPFRYSGTVVALTDGEVLTLSGQDFRQLLLENAELGEKIMKKIHAIMGERTPFSE